MDRYRRRAPEQRYNDPRERYQDDDRYRSDSGDPYLDRGYERERDENEPVTDAEREKNHA